ncbi:hypothetical protein D3C78_1485930 [compost metagenome]
MLFVDDDHAQACKRGKQRRAGADDNRRFAAAGAQPHRQPFAVVKTGVQHLYRRIEAFAKAGDGLRRQADFRHQHQRLFAGRQNVFQHAEIDLGLAGAGDPGQQPGGELSIFAADGAHGGCLLGVQP